MRKLRNSDASSINNGVLRTYHLTPVCRKKLKSALTAVGRMKASPAVINQTGLKRAAISAWLTMFRRSIPYKKRVAYLANAGVDINDKVKLFYMIKSHAEKISDLIFAPVLGQ